MKDDDNTVSNSPYKYKVGDKVQYKYWNGVEETINIGIIKSVFISEWGKPCYNIPTGKKHTVYQKRFNRTVERETVHIISESRIIKLIEE